MNTTHLPYGFTLRGGSIYDEATGNVIFNVTRKKKFKPLFTIIDNKQQEILQIVTKTNRKWDIQKYGRKIAFMRHKGLCSWRFQLETESGVYEGKQMKGLTFEFRDQVGRIVFMVSSEKWYNFNFLIEVAEGFDTPIALAVTIALIDFIQKASKKPSDWRFM